ncbi:hypothetical protein FBU30_005433 [Linnemannia zychae]|nr:hypothetical protein FBU30_005433 [Linnemannia zychae]
MTAPMGNSGSETTSTASSPSAGQNDHRGPSTNTNNGPNGRGNSSPQANGNPASGIDMCENPELDDFVKGFYDGDKFTDVDSRVWV